MVDLYVGPYNERLHVHKSLLCENVPYFHRMFNGSADEAKIQIANFPDDDPEAFDLILRWIYRDSFETIPSVSNFIRKSPLWKSITFYILAEKLCLPRLQDHIMSNVFVHYRSKDLLPSIHMMDCAYSGTSSKSPLRKFIVRGFHWALCRKDSFNVVYDNVDHENGVWSINNLQSLLVAHPDLQRDFLALLREDITPRHLDEFTPCDFHCHSKDEFCHLC
jgi:hypothetical protein